MCVYSFPDPVETSLREQVEKSFHLPPTYETLVSRAQLASVSSLCVLVICNFGEPNISVCLLFPNHLHVNFSGQVMMSQKMLIFIDCSKQPI